ncbi:MAG: family containing protein [Mucilaginibacter sp.]|nr:family containing protein [Mucilaginibacter sp.]
MKRRSFVKTSVLTGAAAAIMPAISRAAIENAKNTDMEFYELRIYSFKNDTQQSLVENYFKNAAIPALNRLGIKHVGVFTELKPTGQTRIFVITPYKSLDDFIKVNDKLESDQLYKDQGSAYLTAPSTDPAYIRIESSLLKAFSHAPKMEVPIAKTRIFELRQYQSASESAGKKKIEMFNTGGEIDMFKRLGFNPVFFSETIIGVARPNLTYMLTYDDMTAHNTLWKAFGSDPEWKKVRTLPEYADSLIVSKITSTFIAPTAYSQI